MPSASSSDRGGPCGSSQAGEVIDASMMRVAPLKEFLGKEMDDAKAKGVRAGRSRTIFVFFSRARK